MRCAILISRSKLRDKMKAARLLQKDILNRVLHCFGSHKKCRANFCKVVQKVQASQGKETSLTISGEQSTFDSIAEFDLSHCNELHNSSTSSWISESRSISIDSESSLLDLSTTDQMSSLNTCDSTAMRYLYQL